MCKVAFWRSRCCDTACGMKVLHWLGPSTENVAAPAGPEDPPPLGNVAAPVGPFPNPWAMPDRWLRLTLLFIPCDMFFSASVTPAERWSLSTGRVIILLIIRETIRDR